MKANHFTFSIHPRLRSLLCLLVSLLTWNVATTGAEVELYADSKSPEGNFSLGTQEIVQEEAESGDYVIMGSRLVLLDGQGEPIGNGPIATIDFPIDLSRVVWTEDESAVAVEVTARLGGRVQFFAIEGDHLVAFPDVIWNGELDELLPPDYEVTRLYAEFEKWESNNVCIVRLYGTAIPSGKTDLSEKEISGLGFRFRLSLSMNKVTISRIE